LPHNVASRPVFESWAEDLRGWKRRVVKAGGAVEGWFDRLRFGFKRRTGWLSPIEILPYRGHGTQDVLFLKGRVLEIVGLRPASAGDSRRRNLRNMVRRFLSSEIPHARVRASLQASHRSHEIEATADEEGFFDLRFELAQPLKGDTAWHRVEIELLWPRLREADEPRATGSVLVPSGARFGVISDLDDTVVQSSATDLLKMARITLLQNAYTRLPFEGVGDFYRALQLGRSGEEFNPIFYVSSSPWNLYDLLEDFLDLHGIPAGPLFLKDWSPTTLGKHEKHKLGVIRTLLATYPKLPFVLIGDSGERDPEIYRQVVQEHPGRIRTIYIRDVTSRERDVVVHKIANELQNLGVEMLLAADTIEAARHASERALISPDSPLISSEGKL
jgi:phosphatidate phosphatase APP1